MEHVSAAYEESEIESDKPALDVGGSNPSSFTSSPASARMIAIPRGAVVLAATPIGNSGDASDRP